MEKGEKNICPVSVLIPTMNRSESLIGTVNSFLESDFIPAEIIVVDQTVDRNERLSIESFIKTITCTKAVYVYQETPSSAISRNTATDLATQEILIYSDDDVIVYPNTVYEVCRQFQDNKLSLLSVWDTEYHPSTSFLGTMFEIFSNGISFHKRNKGHITLSLLGVFPSKIDVETSTEWAMGYFFAVRKSLLEKWNIRWDEALTGYAYAEDLDFTYLYCKKSKDEGYRCVVTKNPSVRHMVVQKNRASERKKICIYVLNRIYISYKHRRSVFCRVAIHWRNWTLGLWMARKKLWQLSDLKYAYQLYRNNKENIKNGNLKEVYEAIE